MIDTHCHLTHPRFASDVGEVIRRAQGAGLTGCVTIGTGAADAERALALARHWPGFVHCAAGIDPFTSHQAGDRFDEALAAIEALLNKGGFVALGEIGLDYHYDLDPAPVQGERLRRQLRMAERFELPVVIHVREAHDDMAAILAEHPRSRGVIHSFTAGPIEAERYLSLGWHLGFNGVATFNNAPEVREAARLAPLDKILVETDSPYLAPVPHRGMRCEPAHVADTLACLASSRECDLADLAAATTRNAGKLFERMALRA
jgi:TatD DNase family protein